jgi:hypothetical protein
MYKRTSVQTGELEVGLMLVGDASDDNVIEVDDFVLLRASFGRGPGDPGFDARVDFDGNRVVDTSDFNLLKVNFGRGGAPPIGSQP